MERLLVVALMLIALLSSTLAFAGNTCMCVWVGSTYLCGGIGGNCGQKRTPSDTFLLSYIETNTARNYFSSQGKSCDPTTGWLCLKRTL